MAEEPARFFGAETPEGGVGVEGVGREAADFRVGSLRVREDEPADAGVGVLILRHMYSTNLFCTRRYR